MKNSNTNLQRNLTNYFINISYNSIQIQEKQLLIEFLILKLLDNYVLIV